MIWKLKRRTEQLIASFVRILCIFLLLSIGFDSMTRIFYSYMPVNHWIDFREVHVTQKDGEAVVVIQRKPHVPAVSIFHRTLLIRYPEERRGCTNTTITLIEDQGQDTLTIPLTRMLTDTCPSILNGKQVDAVLQVSYIFEFPYGVKRFAIKYSNPFSLKWEGGRYNVGPPQMPVGYVPPPAFVE